MSSIQSGKTLHWTETLHFNNLLPLFWPPRDMSQTVEEIQHQLAQLTVYTQQGKGYWHILILDVYFHTNIRLTIPTSWSCPSAFRIPYCYVHCGFCQVVASSKTSGSSKPRKDGAMMISLWFPYNVQTNRRAEGEHGERYENVTQVF